MTCKKLLVVVDMQCDFINGSLGFPGAIPVVGEVLKKINAVKEDPDWGIVVTYDTHRPEYLSTREGRVLPVLHCVQSTEGWQLESSIEAILKGSNYLKVEKPSFGVPAEGMLQIKETFGDAVTEIHVCGLVSNMCVLSNVVIFQSNYQEATLIVDAKATASFSDELHEATLKVLSGLQVQVMA